MSTPPQFPDYQVQKLLGAGSMGQVYLARHVNGQLHALKVLPAELAADETLSERFARELRTLAVVGNHPSLVTIHGSGRTATGLPFFAMDYVEGQTLKAKLREGFSLPEALDALETVADALGYAHRMGLVHRDAKPENIMICDDGSARLLDFGLVKAVHGTSQRLTLTGEIVGTAAYMAREQLADPAEGLVGPPADVFSLGAILYELFALQPPFVGQTSLETFTKLQTREQPPRLAEHPQLNAELRQLCMQALDHDPLKRPPDGLAFRDLLQAARRPQHGSRTGLDGLGYLWVTAALLVGVLTGFAFGRQGRAQPAPAASEPPSGRVSPGDPAPVVNQVDEDPFSDANLIPLSEVPRLAHAEPGTRVTAQSEEGLQVAVVVAADEGSYTLQFTNGESKQLDAAPTRLLPDLFLPGARVVLGDRRARVLERRGDAVYLRWEVGGYAAWHCLRELYLDPGLVPPPDTESSTPRPVFARYKGREKWYAAVELARSSDSVWVIYCEDDALEWLAPEHVRSYPRAKSTLVFDGSPKQEVELIRDLGGVAAMVRTPKGAVSVVSWWQLEVPD